jgi:hypothetical protein
VGLSNITTSTINISGLDSEEHPAIKDLFLSLLNEEEKHKKLIEDKLVDLTKY